MGACGGSAEVAERERDLLLGAGGAEGLEASGALDGARSAEDGVYGDLRAARRVGSSVGGLGGAAGAGARLFGHLSRGGLVRRADHVLVGADVGGEAVGTRGAEGVTKRYRSLTDL